MGSKKPPKPPGVADALFTRTQQRLLALLFVNPDRSYFANEIVRAARSGFGAAHRELASLEAAGLVTARRVGNQKHYQANRSAPIFVELRGIALKTFGVAGVLREALAPLAAKIRAAFVYGSIAKGTDTSASDIDLMVVSEELSYADLFGAAEKAETQLGRKVNPTVYSAVEMAKRAEKDGFMKRVLAQPKIFVIGSEHELGHLIVAKTFREPIGSKAGAPPAPIQAVQEERSTYDPGADVLGVPKRQLSKLCRKYRVRKLSLFGSAARGELKPGSDIDLMVEFEPHSAPSLWDFPEMQSAFAKLFGRKVDLVPPAIMDNPHRRKAIERDLRVVYAA